MAIKDPDQIRNLDVGETFTKTEWHETFDQETVSQLTFKLANRMKTVVNRIQEEQGATYRTTSFTTLTASGHLVCGVVVKRVE